MWGWYMHDLSEVKVFLVLTLIQGHDLKYKKLQEIHSSGCDDMMPEPAKRAGDELRWGYRF